MTEKKRTRPSYSPEFKEEAVSRGKKEGISKASKELGISPITLRSWTAKSLGNPSDSKKPSYQELEKELLRLKKELGYVSDINRILKKSTAILLSDQMGDIK